MNTPTVAPRSLRFFDQDLTLFTQQDTASAARRLARAFLHSAIHEGWPSAWATVRSPEARMRRTLLGVVRAYARPVRPSEPGETDGWETLAADLAWAARAPSVGRALAALRDDVGASAEDVAAVQAALAGEVLPVLHLRARLAARRSADDESAAWHARFLRRWELDGDATEDLVLLYGISLLSLTEDGDAPPEAVDRTIRKLGAAGRLGDGTPALLAEWLVHALTRAVTADLSQETPQSTLDVEIRRAGRLAEDGIRSPALLQLLSLLHLLVGARQMGAPESLGKGAYSFARALAYDPTNRQALEQLQAAAALPAQLRSQVRQLQSAGRARPDADRILGRVERDVEAALGFQGAPEGKRISELWTDTMRAGLRYRLGLAAHQEAGAAMETALLEAIESVGASGDWRPGAEYAAEVRRRAIVLDPGAEDLPWRVLTPILQKLVLTSGTSLTLFLPDPPPPSVQGFGTRIAQAALSEQIPIPADVLFRRASLKEGAARWLLSPLDLGFKVTGALGVVAIVWVTVGASFDAVQGYRLDRAYASAQRGIEQGDDERVVRSAIRFLEIEPSSERDPRVLQLTDWLEEGMIREVVDLVESGREERARELLGRLDALRPVPPPALDERGVAR